MERRAVALRRPHVRAHWQADRGIPRRSGMYSPDGETLAIGGDGYVRSIDARSRRQVADAFCPRCRHRSGIHERRFTTRRRPQRGCWRVGPAWITIHDSSTLPASRFGSTPKASRVAGSPRRAQCPVSRSQPATRWSQPPRRRRARSGGISTPVAGRRRSRSTTGMAGIAPSVVAPTVVAVGLARGFGLVDVRTGAMRRARGCPCVADPPWCSAPTGAWSCPRMLT